MLDAAVLTAGPIEAAQGLLGALLVRGERVARIVECEAYCGREDPGSHAFRGRTPRNDVMFGRAGRAYVYFSYGVHWMLNVVAGPEGEAGAVLVRAAEPLQGVDEMRMYRPGVSRIEALLSGPGKLAAAFEIRAGDNGKDLLRPGSELRLLAGPPPVAVVVGTRIGLSPGKGEDLPLRFGDSGARRWLSRPFRG